jgi:hypothetical protein
VYQHIGFIGFVGVVPKKSTKQNQPQIPPETIAAFLDPSNQQVGANPMACVQQCMSQMLADIRTQGGQFAEMCQRVGAKDLPNSDPNSPYSYSINVSELQHCNQLMLQVYTILRHAVQAPVDSTGAVSSVSSPSQPTVIAATASVLVDDFTAASFEELVAGMDVGDSTDDIFGNFDVKEFTAANSGIFASEAENSMEVTGAQNAATVPVQQQPASRSLNSNSRSFKSKSISSSIINNGGRISSIDPYVPLSIVGPPEPIAEAKIELSLAGKKRRLNSLIVDDIPEGVDDAVLEDVFDDDVDQEGGMKTFKITKANPQYELADIDHRGVRSFLSGRWGHDTDTDNFAELMEQDFDVTNDLPMYHCTNAQFVLFVLSFAH